MKQCNFYGLAGALLLSSFATLAANVSNEYFFIENQVDREYFITPQRTDPRFSGANVFTKYTSGDQLSLGYMGYTGTLQLNSFADIWLEDSPINRPFIGNRCMRNTSACPSNGYLQGYIGEAGVYHVEVNTSGGEALYARGIFSDSAYEYFKNLTVGSVETYKYRSCSTRTNYNPAAGQTCVSVGGRQTNHEFTLTKAGYMRLESTNALQEIFIDSNGNPSLGLGSQFCSVGYIGSLNGVICKQVSYHIEGNALPQMRMSLRVNTGLLGFTPAANTIRLSADGASGWVNYNARTVASTLIKPGNDGIYVFFSQTFLKNLIDRGVDLTRSQDLFTFLFTNTAAPQSGYYEFSPSNSIILRPRDFGISIISKDLVLNPKREGKVGGKEPPIVFDYIVTTSGPKQANAITAQVSGPMEQKGGLPYCVFSSSDGKFRVPFSAYLTYTNDSGQTISSRNSCDNVPISLNAARWMEIPWPDPYQYDGSFYRTDLSLTFPMNEADSMWTLDGRDWMGVVSASGEVRVTATWTGAEIK
ncbi:fimbrial protein [Serratia sp. UGAL515B_01]|uniref:fimbrial protein n=1 Tax=Serratia sp. UGAL515B_01 TaxID=2986763 RepID=UPI00295298D8|nr:fimbrial protein [Serratia sp. UGAL515B_01]WON76150.1 fimbrial protein [Serratia sp. UGAL515B_01]